MIYCRLTFIILTGILVYWAATLDLINSNHWLINAAIGSGWIALYEVFEHVVKTKRRCQKNNPRLG